MGFLHHLQAEWEEMIQLVLITERFMEDGEELELTRRDGFS